ncbi:hypothetical protein Pfo_022744 [Paulownia fortunei]|nr:hypothetical protein Pfo_022744 [Paulownia fortunei]
MTIKKGDHFPSPSPIGSNKLPASTLSSAGSSSTLLRHILGRSAAMEIRPLNEERAVEAATDLLGELFVFSVAGLAMLYEVQRSSRVEAKKEELRKQEL